MTGLLQHLVLACLLFVSAASGEGASHLDVTKAIQPTLAALPPQDAVLIEFFASWCPACRAFKPEYEKAAAFLLKHSAVHVYRLDCAADPDVCDKYKVSGYPTMYVGSAADVAAVAVDKLTKFDYSKFKRNGAGVVQFVAKQLKLDLMYVDEPQDGTSSTAVSTANSNTSTPAGAAPWTSSDVESATRQLFSSITGFHPTEGLRERRAALLMLLQMWSAGHPLPQCRTGAGALIKQLPRVWPEDAARDPWGADAGAASKAPTDVCAAASLAAAPAATDGGYVACKGSTADSRGFTCGLWLLFHTTAARLPEKDGGALLVSALQGFAKYFFQCEVCRAHFVKITSTPEASAVRSRQDGVMWLWRVHNEVNARLQQVESKYGHSSTGDPAFPKLQWPPAADCPLCRLPQPGDTASTARHTSESEGVQWNVQEVQRYLTQLYGRRPDQAAGAAAAAGRPGVKQRSVEGGSAIMQAALEAEEAAGPGSPLRGLATLGGVVLFAAVVLWLVQPCGGGSKRGRG